MATIACELFRPGSLAAILEFNFYSQTCLLAPSNSTSNQPFKLLNPATHVVPSSYAMDSHLSGSPGKGASGWLEWRSEYWGFMGSSASRPRPAPTYSGSHSLSVLSSSDSNSSVTHTASRASSLSTPRGRYAVWKSSHSCQCGTQAVVGHVNYE